MMTPSPPESFVQRFVPDMVVDRLFHGGSIQRQELSRYNQAVVGFFDVSGFSSLARDLEQADKQQSEKALKKRSASAYFAQQSISGKGAEELVRQLNETLAALIDAIRSAGGDIIKFAGDAILVVWAVLDEETLEMQLIRAARCALACTGLKSDQGKLGLHVGIGCGELVAAHVGGTFGRWEFFIAGQACTQSALAEHLSGLNEVVLSKSAIQTLRNSSWMKSITGDDLEDGFILLKGMEFASRPDGNGALLALPPPPAPKYSLSSDPEIAKAAEGYVPGPVRDALKSGGSSSASVGGLRKLTVIFFKLYDVVLPEKFDEESEKRFLEQCQNQAKMVQDSAYHYYATLRQFILDDKGFVAIVCLGLPPYFHEDNAVRAVKVAKRLIEHHKVRASCGICTGTVFCGVVGSTKRAEYSVAGSCINLAARLMAKAPPGTVWCDTITKTEAESSGQISFRQFPSLPFKGFDQPVDIFGPKMAVLLSGKSPTNANGEKSLLTSPLAKKASSFAAIVPPGVENADDFPSPERLNSDGGNGHLSLGVANRIGGSSKSLNKGIERDDSGASMVPKKKRSARVSGSGVSSMPRSISSSIGLVGMEIEQAALMRASFIHQPAVRICCLEGEAGSGKTKLADWIARETNAKRFISAVADSSEMNTPFFVWRLILETILAESKNSNTSSFYNGNMSGMGCSHISLGNGVLGGGPHISIGKNASDAKPVSTSSMKKEAGSGLSQPSITSAPPVLLAGKRKREFSQDEIDPTHQPSHQKTTLQPRTNSDRSDRSVNTTGTGASTPMDSTFMIHRRSQSGGSVQFEPPEAMRASGFQLNHVVASARSSRGDSAYADVTLPLHEDHDEYSSENEEDDETAFKKGGSTQDFGSGGQTDVSVRPLPIQAARVGGGVLPDVFETSPIPPRRSNSGFFPVTASNVISAGGPKNSSPFSNPNGFMPDRSIVLERLHDSGKLKGRRLSSLHMIMPNLIVPTELEDAVLLSPSVSAPPTPSMRANLEKGGISSVSSSSIFGLRAQTAHRRTSFSSKSLPPMLTPSLSTGGAAPAVNSSSIAASPPQTPILAGGDAENTAASMELMLLILEECGILGSTSIVIENAQFMDKQSWELLRRACEFNPSSWKGEHRVRFVITYRPFHSHRDHPLQIILHGPNNAQHTQTAHLSMTSPAGTITAGSGSIPPLMLNATTVSSPPTPQSASNPAIIVGSNVGSNTPNIGLSGNATSDKSMPAAPTLERVISAISMGPSAIARRKSVTDAIFPALQHGGNSRQSASEAMVAAAEEPADPTAIRVVIAPFTHRESGVFLSNVHRVAVGPNMLSFLYKKSKGNPRSLLDCFKTLQDQELIHVDPATGTVEETTSLEDIGDMVFVIPLHLRAQLQQQFDKLMNREQYILKLASVIGDTFPIPLLRWLYRKRVDEMNASRLPGTTSSTTNSGDALGIFSKTLAEDLEENLDSGLKELRDRGFLHPFLHSETQSVEVDGKRENVKVAEEDWVFENDFVRFLVYSQMLHTARKDIHAQVLEWYLSKTTNVRAREDPSILGNHAVGAERQDVAFYCFKEGLRRVVLRGEPVLRGERFWQACDDCFEDNHATGFSQETVVVQKMGVDLLMAQVCLQNEAWDEAKHYLTLVLDLASASEVLIMTATAGSYRRPALSLVSGAVGGTSNGMYCGLHSTFSWMCSWFPRRKSSMHDSKGLSGLDSMGSREASLTSLASPYNNYRGDAVFRDPLAVSSAANVTKSEILADFRIKTQLAKSLTKKITEMQDAHSRRVAQLKAYSFKETRDMLS